MRPGMMWLLLVASGLLLGAPVRTSAEAPKKHAAAAGKKADNVVDNAAITARVKSALLADKVAPGMAINVDTVNGVVTLKGEVDSATQKARAAQVAKKVDGVRKVVNQLVVEKHHGKPPKK
jgi:hyperosmotically inducible periplasmic protein